MAIKIFKLPPLRRQRGAALLILVMVAGLGAATLLVNALGSSDLERIREQRTLMKLAQTREALIGFAVLNGRLPRPAVSATDGRERERPCSSEADCSGFLPWVTLAIDGIDSWGKVLRYSATPSFTKLPVSRGDSIASKTLQSRDAGGALQYQVGREVCGFGDCAPAVIFSQGKNNLGTSAAGAPQANTSATNIDEVGNDNADLHFIARAASNNPALVGGEFDDLVTVVPLPTLFTRMAFAEKLQ